MRESDQLDWNIPQRQSSAGVIVIIQKALVTMIRLLWPVLLVFIFRENNKKFDTFELILVSVPAVILVRSLVEFYFFRFYILNEDLIIKRGFLSRKVVTIPLSRIQSVRIEQNLVHQALHVARLAIDTAGSEKSEAEIDAISVQKAEKFKQFLLRHDVVAPREREFLAPADHTMIRLSITDLLKLGLSANHLKAFFIVLAFGMSAVQDLSEIFGDRVINFVEQSSSVVGVSLASILALIVVVLVVSVIVSLGRIILTYANFQCSETENGLRVQTGLINTKQNLVPLSKIQYMSWEANWIRRQIGLFMLQIHQAQSDHARRKQRIRIPVTKGEYVERLLTFYHPQVKPTAHSQHRIHKVYALRRMLIEGIPLALLTTVLTSVWLEELSLLFLLWIPYVFLASSVYQKRFRLYVSPEAFQVNSGAWGKEIQIAKWYKIQHLQLNQSVFQRRKKLATLVIHTAAGSIKIPYINLELAQTIKNYALYKVESDERSWI